jgi:hypothetical protein
MMDAVEQTIALLSSAEGVELARQAVANDPSALARFDELVEVADRVRTGRAELAAHMRQLADEIAIAKRHLDAQAAELAVREARLLESCGDPAVRAVLHH